MKLWCESGTLPAPKLIARVLSEVTSFRAGAPQSDDITIVVLGPRADG